MKIDKDFLGPSKLKLTLTAALALVAATVAVWGVISHSGKVQRQNAELVMTMTRMTPEPKWENGLTRAALERSLLAARPELGKDAQLCFAAPCWAVVHREGESLLLKWTREGESFTWTELDRAKRQ
ncbi:MAG: hypothetical protein IJ822_10595 [Pyramidobacter sp.]|nr:hypothetical protein [Pyramidobacter sp.]